MKASCRLPPKRRILLRHTRRQDTAEPPDLQQRVMGTRPDPAPLASRREQQSASSGEPFPAQFVPRNRRAIISPHIRVWRAGHTSHRESIRRVGKTHCRGCWPAGRDMPDGASAFAQRSPCVPGWKSMCVGGGETQGNRRQQQAN